MFSDHQRYYSIFNKNNFPYLPTKFKVTNRPPHTAAAAVKYLLRLPFGKPHFLEQDAPYNPLCTHYSNDNDNVVGHSTKYTFYRVTY